MIQRNTLDGVVLLECDGCGDAHRQDFYADQFTLMIDTAKADGWSIRPDGDGGWTHLCKSCKPTGVEAQRKLLGL